MAKQRKDYSHITEDIIEHLDWIQSTIDDLDTSAAGIQKSITEMLLQQIQNFEIKNGKFVSSQDLRSRILNIEEKFEKILSGQIYTHAIKDYLGTFTTIADKTAMLHNDYNDLEVNMKKLNPARQVVYNQAREALYGSGIRSAYREPVKHMMLQQAMTGGTISDMENILGRWTNGDLSSGGKSPTGKPIPNLQQYTTQLARDTSYQFNGTVNNIIRTEYGLEGFRYVGDIIKDSRPLCVYLVNLRRDVSKEELTALLKKEDLKAGRIPGTTTENFCTYRGGYSCRHEAFPVRIKRAPGENQPEQRKGAFSQKDIDALEKKNVRVTLDGAKDDARVIQALNNRIPNFDANKLIDQFDDIAATHGVKWKTRTLEFVEDPGNDGDFLYFDNEGSFNGKEVKMNRRFYLKNGKPFGVYHSLFTVPPGLQGKNFAKELFTTLLEQYKNMGLKEVTVTANINVGGYAWANYGFEAQHEDDVLSIYNTLKEKVAEAGGKYTFEDNKGNRSVVTTKEVERIQQIITAHYDKSPDKLFPMSVLSRRKSGKALLLGSYWSGTLDMTKKRKLRTFENYLNKR